MCLYIYIYMYTFIFVCVCVCVYNWELLRTSPVVKKALQSFLFHETCGCM